MELPKGILPKVLLFSSADGEFASMIASNFVHEGFIVEALCKDDHVLACSSAVARAFRYSLSRQLGSLRAAIVSSRPDLIVCCDDPARYALTRLHRASANSTDPESQEIRALIGRSLGKPEHFDLAEEKSRLLEALKDTEVRMPLSLGVPNAEALDEICRMLTFPVVLKRDRTFGGRGVIICRDRDEAMRGYRQLAAAPTLRDSMRDLVRKGDASALKNYLLPSASVIAAQAYIEGRPANRSVGCSSGEVIAGLTVVALKTDRDDITGPATVVEIVQNAEIDRMASLIVKRLGLSGICGFDFVIETRTGLPYLLELNPRATPTCHLGRAHDSDICGALRRAFGGGLPATKTAVHQGDVAGPIALFPGELRRDPASSYVVSGYHAAPWNDQKVLMKIFRHLHRFADERGHDTRPLQSLLADHGIQVALTSEGEAFKVGVLARRLWRSLKDWGAVATQFEKLAQ